MAFENSLRSVGIPYRLTLTETALVTQLIEDKEILIFGMKLAYALG